MNEFWSYVGKDKDNSTKKEVGIPAMTNDNYS